MASTTPSSPPVAYDEDRLLRHNPAIATGEVDDELFALDIQAGDCFGLDPVGTDIWRLAAQPIRLGTLVDRLVEQYDIDRATCLADVAAYVDRLLEARILLADPA